MTIGEGQLTGTSYRQHDKARAFGYIAFDAAYRPADEELITINGRKYEIDTDAAAGAGGNVLVDVDGNANLDADITDIAAAINTDSSATVIAYADTDNNILWLWAKAYGTAGNAITLTTDIVEAAASGSTLAHGREGGPEHRHVFRHVVTSNDASAGVLRFVVPGMRQVIAWNLRIEDSGVIDDTVDTTVAVTQPNILIVTEGSSPSWAAGDVIVLEVIGID